MYPSGSSSLLIYCLVVWLITFCKGLSSINSTNQKPIPITVLSGFLGSGKTTLLQNLLDNNEGLRIAVIVNDVASVNIDSKLIAGQNAAAGMVELQNGCACCSLSEELLTSVSELVTLSDLRGDNERFHHIVIELSGVADPKSVRAKFQEAALYDMPLMERVQLDTMVTLVDTSTFLDYLKSAKTATPDETPELFYREGKKPTQEEEEWMKDVPELLLEALLAGERASASGPDNGVAELLVSQAETADLVLLNKVDIVDDDRLLQIEAIVDALNPRAAKMRTEYGKVPLRSVLGVAGGRGAVEAGVVDDHRDAVQAASGELGQQEHSDSDCADPECTDTSHSHSHDHECADSDCIDTSHSHSHEHACTEPDCTDTSHSHAHEHGHAGIGTFVYRARRPFHPGRLLSFLRFLPVSRGLPEIVDEDGSKLSLSESTQTTLQLVLRSKGFLWCADSNVAAMFLSHAGSSIELTCLGRWWATLDRSQWPTEVTATILDDYDSPSHEEEDAGSTTVGDRRQEIVFIGQSLDRRDRQGAIGEALDQCLLDDAEWSLFRDKKTDESALRATFPSAMQSRIMSY